LSRGGVAHTLQPFHPGRGSGHRLLVIDFINHKLLHTIFHARYLKVPKEFHSLTGMVYCPYFVRDKNCYLGHHHFLSRKGASSPPVIVCWCTEIILDTEESMDLIELTEAFLAAKQHAFSPNTRRAYRSDLVACAQLLP